MLSGRFLVLFAVVILLVAACGEDDIDATGADPTPTAEETATEPAEPEPEPTATEVVEEEPPAADGEYVLVDTWGEPAMLATPNDVAFAGDGTMFVSDLGLREIFAFNADGELEASWQPVGTDPDGTERTFMPANIAAGSDGTLYVTGIPLSYSVMEFDREGNRLTTMTTGGEDELRHRFMGIKVGDDGRIYALSGSFRDGSVSPAPAYGIYIFSSDGELEDYLALPDGRLPHAMAHDNAGSLYVVSHEPPGPGVERGPEEILRLDTSQAEWDEVRIAVEEIPLIDGLFVDGDGQLFIINQAGPSTPGHDVTTISAIDGAGTVLDEWTLDEHGVVEPAFAPGIATGPDGLTYLADPRNQQVLALDSSMTITDRISAEHDGLVGQIAAMTVGPDGNLYVVDALLQHVLVYDGEGEVLVTLPLPGYLPDVLSTQMVVDVDSAGNVYVGQPHRPLLPLVKLSPGGEVLQEWGPRPFFDMEQGLTATFSPSSVAALDSGDFYITVAQSPWVLLFEDGNDQPTAFWPDSRDHGTTFDLAINNGRVLVLTTVDDEVSGRAVALVELDPSLESELETIVQFPMQTVEQPSDTGLIGQFALDGDGNIYAADWPNRQIIKVGPDGEEITRWQVEQAESSLTAQMMHIAVDDAGRVFITSLDSRQIEVYAPQG